MDNETTVCANCGGEIGWGQGESRLGDGVHEDIVTHLDPGQCDAIPLAVDEEETTPVANVPMVALVFGGGR